MLHTDDDCILIESVSSVKCHHGDIHPLAYESPPPMYSEETILKILLDPRQDGNTICSTWPVNVNSSSTFVIDISKLPNPDDVREDNFGKWKHTGSHQSLYYVSYGENDKIELEKCVPGASGSNVYHLRRLYSSHPSNQAFRRILAFLSGKCQLGRIGDMQLLLITTQ